MGEKAWRLECVVCGFGVKKVFFTSDEYEALVGVVSEPFLKLYETLFCFNLRCFADVPQIVWLTLSSHSLQEFSYDFKNGRTKAWQKSIVYGRKAEYTVPFQHNDLIGFREFWLSKTLKRVGNEPEEAVIGRIPVFLCQRKTSAEDRLQYTNHILQKYGLLYFEDILFTSVIFLSLLRWLTKRQWLPLYFVLILYLYCILCLQYLKNN